MKTPIEKMLEKARKRTEERKANEEKLKGKIIEEQKNIATQEGLLETYAKAGEFDKYADAKERIRKSQDIITLACSMLDETRTGSADPDKNPEFHADMKRLKEAYAADVNPDWKELEDLGDQMVAVGARIIEKTDRANMLRADLRESYGGQREGGEPIQTHMATIRGVNMAVEKVHQVPEFNQKGYIV